MEKYYPKGKIQVVCNPLIKENLHFDHDWFSDESEAPDEYDMQLLFRFFSKKRDE